MRVLVSEGSSWPWLPLSYLLKYAPLSFVRRFS